MKENNDLALFLRRNMTVPTDQEVGQAILEAARYGDLDDMKELKEAHGRIHLDYKGGGGNTALHYGEIL